MWKEEAEAREAGDTAASRYMGSARLFNDPPGAYAPGYMLSPATRVTW